MQTLAPVRKSSTFVDGNHEQEARVRSMLASDCRFRFLWKKQVVLGLRSKAICSVRQGHIAMLTSGSYNGYDSNRVLMMGCVANNEDQSLDS